jgi:hypothetical protein
VFPKQSKAGGEDRYSMAYFGHPVGTTRLEAIPSEMVRKAGEGRKSEVGDDKVLTADDHLMSRLKASYLSMYKDDAGEKM